MRDKKIEKLLSEALLAENRPPLTEEEEEEFLSSVSKEEPDRRFVSLSEGQFAEKVFARRHEKPIRRAEGDPTFSEWLKRLRVDAIVSHQAIAAAICKDTSFSQLEHYISFISQLESGVVLPWNLPAIDVARLIKLYRIHYEAVWDLAFKLTAGKHLAKKRSVITTFVKEPSGSDASPDGPPEEVLNWLFELKESLQRIGATDLLI